MTSARRWRRRILYPAAVAVVLLAALVAAALLTPVYEGPKNAHFDGKRFNNLPGALTIEKSLLDVLRWKMQSEPGPWAQRRDIVYHSPPRSVDDDLRVTFVNHATVLIQTQGKNILTDPIWSARASPVQWLGPARYREPGIRFGDLPPIDLVLISHNHFDHMDADTLARLAAEHDPIFVVPLGNSRYLADAGARNVVELDWWDEVALGTVAVHAVPARHWSRRSAFDTNRALWAGYVVLTEAGPVYFAGDTGMGVHFAEITAVFGPPRLAMLPIGAYLPRWFMGAQHVDPAQALAAHLMMNAAESMAIHFGTFQLGDDGQDEPIRDLRKTMRAIGVPGDTFWIPGNGDFRVYGKDYESLARLTAR